MIATAQLPEGQRVVVREWGETPMDALEQHMRLEDQPPPDPATLGPRDLILRVRSCAVGWVDLIMSSGQYQHMAPPPYTPGLEFAGEVCWAGPEVEAVSVGDAVLADGFHTGPRSSGPYQRWGGFAGYAVIPEAAAMPLPKGLDFDAAVNLLGNYETAYHVLIHRGRLRAGEVALIHGASGSTGLAAVHVAKLVGATVIATGRDPAKLAEVQAQGADHVIETGGEDGLAGLRDAVKALTGGRGAELVYDGVGGPISAASLRAMAFGGRFCIVGWAATPFVARGKGKRGAPNANVLPTNLIQMKGLDVLGCPAVIATKHDPSLRPTRLAWIRERVAEGRLRPHVGPRYALRDYAEALRAKWASRHVGGCVLHPWGD
ncbi:NADPH:quinone oxidoreductase family protein [Pseudenhygromyxa sp. WMMC2535]|uniref:NADPH:quinone oxidoreductase family protein n=1 Tax=Pseudenhygromyxa sp. WMMC2535 TaxID=2712867 RepID=UPI0015560583|nr:NADPH:quinone oxidoreductase family protein [Pseudenhygromyxa sp. WMMC2535]NVB40959.1 NADPH:quinone oxidoreductase family protein [Pseudenhygromyxa sp. WMMC2535]